MTDFEDSGLAGDRLAAARERIAELEMALDVLSATDGRTGLASRNALIDAAARELHRTRRYGGTFGALVCSLTPADDGAHIAAITAAGLRDLDVVATWGEWTIGILFEGLSPDDHEQVWDRIRTLLPVDAAAFAFPDPDTGTSIDADELIAAAERAAADGSGAESDRRRPGLRLIALDPSRS
jgi:GGDEF domain-containing protein